MLHARSLTDQPACACFRDSAPAATASNVLSTTVVLRLTVALSFQAVLSDELAAAWRPRLAELPHVSTVSYNASSVHEMTLRQQLREAQRAVGLKSVLDIFGMPKHSHPLLQNTDVHKHIQVKTICMQLLKVLQTVTAFQSFLTIQSIHISFALSGFHSQACS